MGNELSIYLWGFAAAGILCIILGLFLYSKKYSEKLIRKQFAIKCLGIHPESANLKNIIKNPEFWGIAEEVYFDIILGVIEPQSGDSFAFNVIRNIVSRRIYNAKKGEFPDEIPDSSIPEKMIIEKYRYFQNR